MEKAAARNNGKVPGENEFFHTYTLSEIKLGEAENKYKEVKNIDWKVKKF